MGCLHDDDDDGCVRTGRLLVMLDLCPLVDIASICHDKCDKWCANMRLSVHISIVVVRSIGLVPGFRSVTRSADDVY